MQQNYAYQGDAKHTAKALGKSLPISTKQSVEICKAIKGKSVERARVILKEAAAKERPIRFTRFTDGAGHKRGNGPGKYPVKACTEILKILNSAEANAQDTGLAADLVVEHAVAHGGSRSLKYGRHARRKNKSTHVEIIVKEAELKPVKEKKSKKSENKGKKTQKKSEKKSDKKEAKKDEKSNSKESKKEKTDKKEESKNNEASKDDEDSSGSKASSDEKEDSKEDKKGSGKEKESGKKETKEKSDDKKEENDDSKDEKKKGNEGNE